MDYQSDRGSVQRRIGNVGLVIPAPHERRQGECQFRGRRGRREAAVVVLLGLVSLVGVSLGAAGCTSSTTPSTDALRSTTTTAAVSTTITPITKRATIVLVVPTTGALVGLGAEAKEGLELALRHATEDGRVPPDMSIRIKVLDEQARSLARAVDRAVRENDVIAVVGGLLPTTEGTLVPVARRRKVGLFVLTWGSGEEPTEATRIGPARDIVASAGVRFITAANRAVGPLLVLGAPPGASGANAARNTFIEVLSAVAPSAEVDTNIPPDPAAVATTPIVVTGESIGSFALFGRLRLKPVADAPSIVVPTDAVGCDTKAFGIADGTRCVTRGAWLTTSVRARTFVEDAAAQSIVASWATASAYDVGTYLTTVATPSGDSPARALRISLTATKTANAATFSGVNGTFVPGVGFPDAAQVLRAEQASWVLEPDPVATLSG